MTKFDILKMRQQMPLEMKVAMSKNRISQFWDALDGQVYVSFSGGKDSTVLLDLVRSMHADAPAVFFDTGLEFPEIRDFVKTFENVEWVRPAVPFTHVLRMYGFPVVSKETSQKLHEIRTTKSAKLLHKRLHGDSNQYRSGKIAEKWKFLIDAPFKISHKCCDVMKKRPAKVYQKRTGRFPFVGTMTEDSQLRKQAYLRAGGCNSFEGKVQSTPMAFWTEADVWEYIKTRGLNYSRIYDMGEDRTGCMFCAFGCHKDKINRFQRMKINHPKHWQYCMDRLGMREVLDFLGVPCE